MVLTYLLFVVYLVLLCWLLLRIPFYKNAGINKRLLLALFLLKICAGIVIGWVSIHIYGPGNDYWDMHDFALEEYQLLFSDTGRYFSNLFTSDYQHGYSGLFRSSDSYWNDLRSNIVVKLVSLFNIFSLGSYYINSLFFNFIVFFGHICFYRLFIGIFPKCKWQVIVGAFLLPSALYFSSGIHKDGLVFLLLAVLLYSVHQSIIKNKVTVKRFFLILISFFLLLLLRNYVCLALLPALFAWTLTAKTKWRPAFVFGATYLAAGLVLFNLGEVAGRWDPLNIIINKQKDYSQLPLAATQIQLTPLQPTIVSFVANAPEAVNHSLMRPYVWDTPVQSTLPFALELLGYELLLLLVIFFRSRHLGPASPAFLFFAFSFCLAVFLLIGYIVPNLGSLVRYRSLYLPICITPMLCMVDWIKLLGFIRIKKYDI